MLDFEADLPVQVPQHGPGVLQGAAGFQERNAVLFDLVVFGLLPQDVADPPVVRLRPAREVDPGDSFGPNKGQSMGHDL